MTSSGSWSAVREVTFGLGDYRRWATLAWIDTSLRYRRTVLGPWWVTISTGVMVGSVGMLYGGIFGNSISEYMPFFAAGIVVWMLISATLTESGGVFAQTSGIIKSIPGSLVQHIYRLMTRQLIVFAHNFVLVCILWIVFEWPLHAGSLLALPGLLLVCVALFGGSLVLSILCTRFRDVQQIITALLQLFFMLTPIIWSPGNLRDGRLRILVDFNPFYYLVEVVRGPLLGQVPNPTVWLAASGCAAALLGAGLLLYGRFSHRIPYWL